MPDGKRKRRHSKNKAKREWYALHRQKRFAKRSAGNYALQTAINKAYSNIISFKTSINPHLLPQAGIKKEDLERMIADPSFFTKFVDNKQKENAAHRKGYEKSMDGLIEEWTQINTDTDENE